jgi:hypothetical protein
MDTAHQQHYIPLPQATPVTARRAFSRLARMGVVAVPAGRGSRATELHAREVTFLRPEGGEALPLPANTGQKRTRSKDEVSP